VLRAHRLGADLTARDSARFSIVGGGVAGVKQRLRERLTARDRAVGPRPGCGA